MKRSLVAFVALGLMAGLVSCAGISFESEEDTAGRWVREHISEASEEILQDDLKDFIDCLMDAHRVAYDYANDQLWQTVKKGYEETPFTFRGLPSDDLLRPVIYYCGSETLSSRDLKTLESALF